MAKTRAVLAIDDKRSASLFPLSMPLMVLALTSSCLHGNLSHKPTMLPRDMTVEMRVARPTDHLDLIVEMYRDGLGFEELGSFEDHEGFDGVMLGEKGSSYHLEFTHHRGHQVGQAPTKDNLLVFYFPDEVEWNVRCEQMKRAGFVEIPSYNPYWDRQGKTFEDIDGYRVVLQNSRWE